MRGITEISRADTKELLDIAKHRRESFPILKEIYDDNYLSRLVRRKNDYDNLLLTWLVIDNPFATKFFQEIEENLEILQPESTHKFKNKLRQWHTEPFESTITEIEFAAEYKRKGFQIEFEPTLPNGKKGEFCVSRGSLKIFFEVKIIFPQRSHEERLILNELEDRYSRLDTSFVIGFDLKKSFPRSQTFGVVKHIKEKLEHLERTKSKFPQSFVYPEGGEPIIMIDVLKRLPKGGKGYISGVFGGGLKGNWNDLRSKISSGISQLHPDYPGLIIVQPLGLSMTHYDIKNALLGDLKVNISGERAQEFRGGNRILAKKKNKRLSAVIYYEKRLHGSGYTKKKFVYHNLNPNTELSPEIFKGENVIQFKPTKQNGWIYFTRVD